MKALNQPGASGPGQFNGFLSNVMPTNAVCVSDAETCLGGSLAMDDACCAMAQTGVECANGMIPVLEDKTCAFGLGTSFVCCKEAFCHDRRVESACGLLDSCEWIQGRGNSGTCVDVKVEEPHVLDVLPDCGKKVFARKKGKVCKKTQGCAYVKKKCLVDVAHFGAVECNTKKMRAKKGKLCKKTEMCAYDKKKRKCGVDRKAVCSLADTKDRCAKLKSAGCKFKKGGCVFKG